MVFPNLVKFQVKETDQSITPFAGLALIGRLAKQLRLLDRINQTLPFKERERGFHPSEVVMSIANVFLAGGTCLNDVHAFDSDAALTKLFGIKKFPDDSTLGVFLRKFTKLAIFRLGHLNTTLVRRLISEQGLSRLTIDSDSSIFPSHKKDALWTYVEKIRGYNPLFASIADGFSRTTPSPSPSFAKATPRLNPTHSVSAMPCGRRFRKVSTSGFALTVRGFGPMSSTSGMKRALISPSPPTSILP